MTGLMVHGLKFQWKFSCKKKAKLAYEFKQRYKITPINSYQSILDIATLLDTNSEEHMYYSEYIL